jgi:RNA-directed DNA polymerase
MKIYKNLFQQIVSLENLFAAWDEFRVDKRRKKDVQAFEFNLERNIFQLNHDLITKQYKHQQYTSFYINDPKVRRIHKATVRDRILHHAIFRVLNPIFEETFIAHSFSCRVDKGTHKGIKSVEEMIIKESRNYTRPCFVLKCDIQKFFDSVDHNVLLAILNKRINDVDTMWLMNQIIQSFPMQQNTLFSCHGLPIGNLTSQLFANIYMNEFDQFVKHKMKIEYYARYTDDFVVISTNKKYLENLIILFQKFLENQLKLSLHPKKVFIRKINQGIDFLGYIILPHYRLLRTKTKNRIFRKLKQRAKEYNDGLISKKKLEQSLQSYLGVLSHAKSYRIKQDLLNQYFFDLNKR